VNAKDGDGDTPLDQAVSSPLAARQRQRDEDKKETAALLRKHGAKHGTIPGAAAGGDTEAVKGFLAAGADVNVKDADGWTPLHRAALFGRKEAAELLIANGASVNAIIVSGRNQEQTPLNAAIAWERTETADLLRKHGGKTKKELKAE